MMTKGLYWIPRQALCSRTRKESDNASNPA